MWWVLALFSSCLSARLHRFSLFNLIEERGERGSDRLLEDSDHHSSLFQREWDEAPQHLIIIPPFDPSDFFPFSCPIHSHLHLQHHHWYEYLSSSTGCKHAFNRIFPVLWRREGQESHPFHSGRLSWEDQQETINLFFYWIGEGRSKGKRWREEKWHFTRDWEMPRRILLIGRENTAREEKETFYQ